MKDVLLSLCVCALFVNAAAAQSPPRANAAERRTVTAVRLGTEDKITLDGQLDEAAWSRATPAKDFIQQLPKNGALGSERTEVRFVFSRDALYMGVICFDADPRAMRGSTIKRDDFLGADDRFMWVIDPLLNGQTGYFFEMNPSGLMADALMGPLGQMIREWDGVWDSVTRQSDIGWTIEIKFPFRMFNFNPDGRGWGINMLRTVRRRQEDSLWMSWGLNQGLFRMENTGLLVGITDVSQGRGLELRPYALATSVASPGRGQAGAVGNGDVGADFYYSLTPALRTNLTINTDFAQTEVDQRQVNLTRFSLFFPEKRAFFNEGGSFFDFASTTQGRFGSGIANDTAVVPFFTRRIGLTGDGLPQKIDFGGKLTGQIGRQDVGVLQIRTADDGGAPGEDFTVARFKRRMLRQSYVGALYTRRATRGAQTPALDTLGLDYRLGTATFRGRQILEASGYLLRTSNPADTGENYAYGFGLDYPNDRYFATVSYREVQDNYNPAVGFTLRDGYRRYAPTFRFQPRPRNNRLVRQYTFGVDGDLQYDTDDNSLLLRSFDVTAFKVGFQSGDSLTAGFVTTHERLDDAFRISPRITLPRGSTYDYTRLTLQASTSSRRTLAVTASFDVGSFYSGERRRGALTLGLRPRPGLVVSLNTELNEVDLAEGRFTTRLYRAIAETHFNPWAALTNNIQFDSVSGILGWQSRFRWIPLPGSDVYFVYNHNWTDDPTLSRFSTVDRRAASKILYTFGF